MNGGLKEMVKTSEGNMKCPQVLLNENQTKLMLKISLLILLSK
jgi:hypothetical protein